MNRRATSHRPGDEDQAKAKDPAEARKRLLDAAEELFAARGFDATPTAHIARQAGVPKGLLFYYFPAKADLLSTLLAERFIGLPWRAEDLAIPGDPLSSLVRLADAYRTEQESSPLLRIILWREELTHPEVAVAVEDHRRSLEDLIQGLLERSLPVAVDRELLGAAAQLWSALLASPDRGKNDPVQVRCAASLMCAGLLSRTATPSG